MGETYFRKYFIYGQNWHFTILYIWREGTNVKNYQQLLGNDMVQKRPISPQNIICIY